MAAGKPIGEYSMKSTSWTLRPGPAGSTVIDGNFEGTATGFGSVLGTGTFLVGKIGTFSYCGAACPDDGDIYTARAPEPTRALASIVGARAELYNCRTAAR
jgi:hypothetical protein